MEKKGMQSKAPVMGTKAETLQYLKEKVTHSFIEDMAVVTLEQLQADRDGLCAAIEAQFAGALIVVRSSCKGEDGYLSSNAGHFESILHVDSSNADQVAEAVRQVALSYEADIPEYAGEQVLIQRQTKDVAVSGVIFTRDIKEDRPYYMITYDRSGSTDSVTSGASGQQLWIARDAAAEILPEEWRRLIAAVREIQLICQDDRLDIEFAVRGDGQVVVFQVRPLAASYRYQNHFDGQNCAGSLDCPDGQNPTDGSNCAGSQSPADGLNCAGSQRLADGSNCSVSQDSTDDVSIPCPVSLSDQAFFQRKELAKARYGLTLHVKEHRPMMLSDMAFWNPVEMIGDNPHPLAYSLYREMITSTAWNRGLRPLGYRKIHADIMYAVGNKPYISVDYAFEALIPNTIEEKLAKKLAAYYRRTLQEDLTAHDKIEFEIVFSCFDFTVDQRLETLIHHGFTQEEKAQVRSALYEQTVEMIRRYPQILETDLQDIAGMHANCCAQEAERRLLLAEPVSMEKLIWISENIAGLLNDICHLGTPQFSRQARLAFVARSLCNTMVERGFVTEQEMEAFMSSIHTVASEYHADYKACRLGTLDKTEFFEKYGHLRSGTYDINTSRYDQLDLFGKELSATIPVAEQQSFDEKEFTTKVERAVAEADFPFSAEKLLQFCRMAMEQREYFKFAFTRSLSLCLELIADMGAGLGIDRADMAYLEVADILAGGYYADLDMWKRNWERMITRRKEYYRLQRQLILPEVIQRMSDLDCIPLLAARPNFITTRKITGQVVNPETEPAADITGKIVLLQKADPGYDWIFTRHIGGLVTQYGGAASHMAIRCAEFGIPAAIGCGAKWYETIRKAEYLTMDCRNGLLQVR